MADNLDDFFAKRDKGKKKGKKFTTVDDATKVLETKAKERIKATTGKSTYTAPANETGDSQAALSEYRQQQDEDDEWLEQKEFEPDYTGLKIQELILEDSDDELASKDMEVKEDGDADGGPWNKVLAKKAKEAEERKVREAEEAKVKEAEEAKAKEALQAEKAEENKDEPAAESTDEPKETEEKPEVESSETPAPEESIKTGGYVPPNRRNVQEAKPAAPAAVLKPCDGGGADLAPTRLSTSSSSNAYVPPSRRGITTSAASAKSKKSGGPLNITNEESFPTLGS